MLETADVAELDMPAKETNPPDCVENNCLTILLSVGIMISWDNDCVN